MTRLAAGPEVIVNDSRIVDADEPTERPEKHDAA
jgi:hypothetical protein